jgi:ABC-type thiamine transport system ATPase subunit
VDGALLELSGLTWESDGTRRGLTPAHLTVGAGETAVVAAADSAEAELFTDILLNLDGKYPAGDSTIRVGDKDVTEELPEDREIGLVPAGGALLPHLTVERNLVLTAREGLPPSHVRAKIRFKAGRMGIEGFLRSRPDELAHDELLTIAVVRVLCRRLIPKVLLIEDRKGHGPCHAAVGAAERLAPRMARLVVTDDRTRVASLAAPARSWEITNVTEP